MRRFFKFTLRFLLGILILILALLLAISLVLFVPKVQEYVSQEAGSFVSKKIGTKVRLEGLYLNFPNGVAVNQLYIEDQSADTLIYADNFQVSLDYFALIHSEVEVSNILLENTTANIRVAEDSTFNFDFILKAFAGESEESIEPKESTSPALAFDIGIIELNNVRFSYYSAPDGMHTNYSVGKLLVDIDEFDLEKQHYIAKSINLENTSGNFEIFKSVPSNTDTSSSLTEMIVGAHQINIASTRFKLIDQTSQTTFSTQIGELNFLAEPINLLKQEIIVNELAINNSSVKVQLNSSLGRTDTSISENSTADEKPWSVSLSKFSLENFDFNFDDNGVKKIDKGVDYAHLGLTIKSLESNSIYFNGINDLGLSLSSLAATEQSGLKINDGEFKIKLDSNQVSLKDLLLKTPTSSIDAEVLLNFKSLEKIAEDVENLKLNIKVNNTIISPTDLLYFAPDLETNESISPYIKQKISLDGKILGSISDLAINNFFITIKHSTSLAINGQLKGLPKIETLAFNFNKIILKTNPSDLNSLLPDSTIPRDIHLPNNMKLNATASGSIKDLTSKLSMITSYGNLTSKIKFQQPSTNTYAYQIDLDIPQFDLASLLQDTTLGNIGFKGDINGHGLSLSEMELELDAVVKDFEYLNYRYSDLNIKGKLQEEAFEGGINMNDSNLIFSFNGKADLDSLNPAFDFTFDLAGVDLQHLNISKYDYRINGGISADFTGNSLENLNGNLDVRDVLVLYKGEQYHIDSLLCISIIDSGKTDISIKSNLLDASFNGNIYLSDIAETLEAHFKGKLSDSIVSIKKEQDFKFDIKIHDPDILTEVFLPDLNSFETGEIKGEFDSQKDILALDVNFPKINYAEIVLDSLSFRVNSNSSKINSELSIKRISYDTLSVQNISFLTVTEGKEALLSLQIQNENEDHLLQLKGILNQTNKEFRFHFEEEEQFINSNQWNVNQANELIFGDSTYFNQVVFSNDDQKVAVSTNNKHHRLSFSNFELSSLFNVISQNQEDLGQYNSAYQAYNKKKIETNSTDTTENDSPSLLKGTLNGSVNFPIDSTSNLKASLDLENLQLSEVPIGDLKAYYSQELNKDSIKVTLDGNGNNLVAKGFISKNEMILNLSIKKLKMNTLEAFSGGKLKNTQGYLTGNAELVKQNEVYNTKGELTFNSVRLRSTYLGETYYLENEKITLSKEKITLSNFTILDSAKQPFVTDGTIEISEITNPKFNLNVKINHFQFLNTTKESANDLFYGNVLASADIKVTGKLNQPRVSSKLELEKGTDITFVVPEEEASEVNREGIVAFVDKDEKIPLLLRRDKNKDTVKIDVLGIDLTSVINIDEKTKITIIIDPVTGDRLKIQGGGEIRADVDPSGRVSMNGLYTIENGDYELKLYNLVKRKFALEKGSKLIWSGPPLEAKMDIKGVFVTKASPLGLLGDQVSSLSDAERNSYKKRIPFKVLLLLGGEILKPDINFRIELPEDQKASAEGAVNNKLAQLNNNESELNRQVFSLIILKRFYTQSPTSGGGGSYLARESVSQILTSQLNSLTDKYVKGVNVELSVDSYNDYSSEGDLEGTTDVNLALSKNLFDDRVVVRVDGDFNVENNDQQSGNSAIAGDVSVEYKITEDGKYRVKVFRKDEYEGIIEGEFVETGVSLIYNREFSKFNELFRKEENKTIESERE